MNVLDITRDAIDGACYDDEFVGLLYRLVDKHHCQELDLESDSRKARQLEQLVSVVEEYYVPHV